MSIPPQVNFFTDVPNLETAIGFWGFHNPASPDSATSARTKIVAAANIYRGAELKLSADKENWEQDVYQTARSTLALVKELTSSKELVSKPYYHGTLSRPDAEKLLEGKENGAWLIRYSDNVKCYVVSLRHDSNTIKHLQLFPGANEQNFITLSSLAGSKAVNKTK